MNLDGLKRRWRTRVDSSGLFGWTLMNANGSNWRRTMDLDGLYGFGCTLWIRFGWTLWIQNQLESLKNREKLLTLVNESKKMTTRGNESSILSK
jgi:hypothetical protein